LPEASQIEFKLKEVAEILVRAQGITEGHWMVFIRFGFAAANIDSGTGELGPATISRIETIGIQRAPEPNSISVDASEISSKPKAKRP